MDVSSYKHRLIKEFVYAETLDDKQRELVITACGNFNLWRHDVDDVLHWRIPSNLSHLPLSSRHIQKQAKNEFWGMFIGGSTRLQRPLTIAGMGMG